MRWGGSIYREDQKSNYLWGRLSKVTFKCRINLWINRLHSRVVNTTFATRSYDPLTYWSSFETQAHWLELTLSLQMWCLKVIKYFLLKTAFQYWPKKHNKQQQQNAVKLWNLSPCCFVSQRDRMCFWNTCREPLNTGSIYGSGSPKCAS